MDKEAFLKGNFAAFADLMWREYLNLPKLDALQREVCWWLQYGPKKAQVWAYRGMGKSYLMGAFVIWALWRNPDEIVLVLSGTAQRSNDFVLFAKRLMREVPFLKHLQPDPEKGHRDQQFTFDVGPATTKGSPSVKAASITGMITGSRATLCVLDDVETPENSATPDQREKLAHKLSEISSIMVPDSPERGIRSTARVLGTPQSMQTVYRTLEDRGYEVMIWPVEIPDHKTLMGYGGNLAPSILQRCEAGEAPGSPTEPLRFHQEEIERVRIENGAMGFALQFMLSTALSDAEKYPLKTQDIIVGDYTVERAREYYVHTRDDNFRIKEIPNVGLTGDGFFRAKDEGGEWTKYDRTVLAVDPSGRGKDETVCISAGQIGGNVCLLGLYASLDGYSSQTMEAIAIEAKRVKADTVLIESNYSDGMFAKLLMPILKRIYPCKIEEVKHSVMKERRIVDTLAPALEAHKIIASREFVEKDSKTVHAGETEVRSLQRRLWWQMTHMTVEKGCLPHDDRIDCLGMLIAYLGQYMNLDAREEARMRLKRRQEMEDDAPFIAMALQNSPSMLSCFDSGRPSPLSDLLK